MIAVKSLPQEFCFFSPFRSTHERCISVDDVDSILCIAGVTVERRGNLYFARSDFPVSEWPSRFGVSVK